ncbi:MAG: hypothetical protein ABJN36_18725 [Cyclobacteriaceae bacterium]
MFKKKTLKLALITLVSVLVLGGGIGLYLFNLPHRDIQSTNTDFKLTASQVVAEYLINGESANEKYLDEEGESRILEVSGSVASVTEDYNGQKVVLLQSADDKAGVSCTFTTESNIQLMGINPGQKISVKGVIRSGATYDEDLEMYENVIMEKCALVL